MYLRAVNEPGSEWKAPGNAARTAKGLGGKARLTTEHKSQSPKHGPLCLPICNEGSKVPERADSRGTREPFRGRGGERKGNGRLGNGFLQIIHSD
jgi:hypothetical protein